MNDEMINNDKIIVLNSINTEIKKLKKQMDNLVASKKRIEQEIIENFPPNEKNIMLENYKISLKYKKTRVINEDYVKDNYPSFYNSVLTYKINLKSFDEEVAKPENSIVLQDINNIVDIQNTPSSITVKEISDEDF